MYQEGLRLSQGEKVVKHYDLTNGNPVAPETEDALIITDHRVITREKDVAGLVQKDILLSDISQVKSGYSSTRYAAQRPRKPLKIILLVLMIVFLIFTPIAFSEIEEEVGGVAAGLFTITLIAFIIVLIKSKKEAQTSQSRSQNPPVRVRYFGAPKKILKIILFCLTIIALIFTVVAFVEIDEEVGGIAAGCFSVLLAAFLIVLFKYRSVIPLEDLYFLSLKIYSRTNNECVITIKRAYKDQEFAMALAEEIAAVLLYRRKEQMDGLMKGEE